MNFADPNKQNLIAEVSTKVSNFLSDFVGFFLIFLSCNINIFI